MKDATTDFATIRRWWASWPDANIGIATGLNPATGTGLHVIDIDTAKGAQLASLDGLGFDDLPNLLTVRTGSGGYHLYLSCEEALPNSANRLGPFIDTRGEGGYVVAPPSRNLHGKYTWLRPLEMLPMPPQLLAKLRERGSAPYSLNSSQTFLKDTLQERTPKDYDQIYKPFDQTLPGGSSPSMYHPFARLRTFKKLRRPRPTWQERLAMTSW